MRQEHSGTSPSEPTPPDGSAWYQWLSVGVAILFSILTYVIAQKFAPPTPPPPSATISQDIRELRELILLRIVWFQQLFDILCAFVVGILGYLVVSFISALRWRSSVSNTLNMTKSHASLLVQEQPAIQSLVGRIAQNTNHLVMAEPVAKALNELANTFGCRHPIALYQDWASGIGDGKLTIFDMAEVYKTDVEILKSHQTEHGDIYATVITTDESAASTDPTIDAYLDATIGAATRANVKVYRFYFVESIDRSTEDNSTARKVVQHIHDKVRHNHAEDRVKLFVISKSTFEAAAFDLVAFGSRCISFGRIEKLGKSLIGAEYDRLEKAPTELTSRLQQVKALAASCDNGSMPKGVYPAENYLKLKSGGTTK